MTTKFRVDGYRCQGAYCLECNQCGPLGISESYVYAVSEVKFHLNGHGVDTIKEFDT